MTVIDGAARAVNPNFIRPAPKPANITPADSAPAAKLVKSKPVGDVAAPRFQSASIGATRASNPVPTPPEGDIATPRFRSATFQGAQVSKPGSTHPGPEVDAPGFKSATFKGAQVSKPGATPPTPEVDVFQIRSASISTPQSPKADPPAISSISGDAPEVTLEMKMQKALDSAMQKFEESGGGNFADLQRVLYESVWNTLQYAGETNTPVKAAFAVNDYIQSMKDNEGTPNSDHGAASIAGLVPIGGDTPTISDAGFRVSSLDIRI